jgi:hypothetical protein
MVIKKATLQRRSSGIKKPASSGLFCISQRRITAL